MVLEHLDVEYIAFVIKASFKAKQPKQAPSPSFWHFILNTQVS